MLCRCRSLLRRSNCSSCARTSRSSWAISPSSGSPLFALVGPSASSAFAAAGEESLGSAAVDPIEHEEDLDEGMGLLQDTHKEEDKSKLVRTQKAVMSCGHLLNKPTSSLYVVEFRTLCEAVALSAGGQTPALLERIKAFLDPER